MTTFRAVVTAGPDVGPQSPAAGAPDRTAGSVRRTCSLDVNRPGGSAGPILVDGRARDAVTTVSGAPPRSTAVALHARLDPFQELQEIPLLRRARVGRRVFRRLRIDDDVAEEFVEDARGHGFRGYCRL